MTAFDFSKEAVTVCSEYNFIQGIEIQLLDEPVVKIKAVINDDAFINIFYNAKTSKYSFTLIKNNNRIYGADNAKKWHIHPFDDPDSHVASNNISLGEFLEGLTSNRNKW